jgi:hypothetical protein
MGLWEVEVVGKERYKGDKSDVESPLRTPPPADTMSTWRAV